MKTLAQITEALAQPYDGLTYEKNGFTYIPWNLATKEANEVFGIDGYNVDLIYVKQTGAGFEAKVRVTVYTEEGVTFYREGVGYNELTGDNGRAFDTSVKGAASDGLNRALKLFGPRFGLNLYDKGDSPTQQTEQRQASSYQRPQGQAPRQSAAAPKTFTLKNPDAPISENQMKALAKFGIDGTGMTMGEASEAIDAAKAGGAPAPRAPQRARTPDDLDEFLASVA